MPTGLHGTPSGKRFESSQSSGWMSCHDLSRFFLRFQSCECRWNYIAHNDVVAGSNPARLECWGVCSSVVEHGFHQKLCRGL
jgi:hypothetical protein